MKTFKILLIPILAGIAAFLLLGLVQAIDDHYSQEREAAYHAQQAH